MKYKNIYILNIVFAFILAGFYFLPLNIPSELKQIISFIILIIAGIIQVMNINHKENKKKKSKN